VEIAGEDEEERVLRDKARWYLDHGVSVVWIIFPETRQVLVMGSADERRFSPGERLPSSEALPDLAPEVTRFFAQLDR
jgi:Uma2 family endonuclease